MYLFICNILQPNFSAKGIYKIAKLLSASKLLKTICQPLFKRHYRLIRFNEK